MWYRWKHPSKTAHLLGWLQGFAELADGLVTLLTFATYSSGFEMAVAVKRAKYHHVKQSKAARNKESQ